MRILIINPILYTSETDTIPKVNSIKDTMIYTICLGFLKKRHKVILAAAADYRPEAEEDYPFDIIWMKTKYKKICKPRCLPYMPELASYIKKNAEDINAIITSEVFSLHSLTAVRTAPDKTIVWHELGTHNKMLHYIPSKVWYHFIARFLFKKTVIVPRSEKAREFISAFCGRVSDITIDHGVNIDKIHPYSKKRDTFAVVSQLIPRKRIDKILKAFASFREQNEETGKYLLHIAGKGEAEDELRVLSNQLQLGDSVIFHGQLSHEQLVPITAAAKALLIYTKKDNNMVSIVESIAAGTPVITTSIPFNAAYIKKEELGIVKDDWGKDDLNTIVKCNEHYIENCLKYRNRLSADYCVEQFETVFAEINIK